MFKQKRTILLSIGGLFLLGILLYQIPAIKSRVDWRIERITTYMNGVIHPAGPVPTALLETAVVKQETNTPLPTRPATLVPQITATATPAPLPLQVFLPPPAFEDVAFGPLHMGLSEDEVRARVDEALKMVHMTNYRDRLCHHLSVGEKKRISIATVLSMHPQILILDEPSAGLDPRARRKLINLLHEMPITMLVSTHDMALVKECFPRTIVMDEGKIVADGMTTQILDDAALLETHGLEKP